MDGKIIKGRYKITQELTRGGFGKIFLAIDQDCWNRQCLVKKLEVRQENADPDLLCYIQSKFKQEAKVLHRLSEEINQYPSLRGQIPEHYAYFCEAGEFYLVQEWVQGTTLEKKLKQKAFSEAQLRQLLLDLLPVLQAVHDRDIVHRDIKPSNLIIRDVDSKPVLIDFGIVKEIIQSVADSQGPYGGGIKAKGNAIPSTNSDSTRVGTPGFRAPEQEQGQHVCASTDLYGLGITAIYALTGENPNHLTGWGSYRAIQLQRHQLAGVSNELVAVLSKAIQVDSFDRYRSAQEMLEAVKNLPPLGSAGSMLTTVLHPVLQKASKLVKPVASGRRSYKLLHSRSILLCAVSATVAIGMGYLFFKHRDLRLEYEAAKQSGDYQACVNQANRLTQFRAFSLLNSNQPPGAECAEALALRLQNYLRVGIPQLLNRQNSQKLALTIQAIEPTVQLTADQVVVSYSAMPESGLDDKDIQWLTALFMSAIRGTPEGIYPTQHTDFDRLIVYAKGSNKKATLSTQEWNDYLQEYAKAPDSQKESVKRAFFDRVHVSNQ